MRLLTNDACLGQCTCCARSLVNVFCWVKPLIIAHMDEDFAIEFKDVRAKIFQSIDFLDFYCSQMRSCCVRNAKKQKKIGGHQLRFRDKACGKLP